MPPVADDDKNKQHEEEPLEVVTDDVETLKAKGIEAKGKKPDADDEEAPEDQRLGDSDADRDDAAEREQLRAERRRERKERNAKKHQREAERLELQRENRFLRTHNERLERSTSDMAKRLDALEGTTIDGRISQFRAAIAKADRAIAEATTESDGEALVEAQNIRDDLKSQLARLEGARTRQSEDKRRAPDVDPELIAQARTWADRNEWFDFNRGDEDSAIAGALDDMLQREGRLDPATPAYWAELDKRIAKRLPHLKNKSAKNGHDDEDDRGDDDDEGNEANRPQRRSANGGGPRFRRGGADTVVGKNQVFLSRERLEALREAGYEEGSSDWNRMLKRYQKHDLENPR